LTKKHDDKVKKNDKKDNKKEDKKEDKEDDKKDPLNLLMINKNKK
jgi:hypothetical protein